METTDRSWRYRIRWLSNIVRHGLLVHGLRNRLARVGIDIMPYYWVREGTDLAEAPMVSGDSSGFVVMPFGEEEIRSVKRRIVGIEGKDLLRYLRDGQTCLGIKNGDDIVAYMFIRRDGFTFRGRDIELEPNEAYLHSMYIFESYRGRNVAPFLRCHSYRLASEQGVDGKYSISEAFNRATIRFKKKLNSEPLALYMSVVLFERFRWNVVLREYGRDA